MKYQKSTPASTPETTVKGYYYDAQLLTEDIGSMIYNQLKAKIFDLLESQFDNNSPKLAACKRIAEGFITSTAKDVNKYLLDILGSWEIEVVAGGELNTAEELEALK